MSNEIQNWVDPAMFEAEKMPEGGPKVHLLWMTPDPLGAAAAMNAMYTGKVKRSLADVTHAERQEILGEMSKTILATPLEAVNFHFLIEGVTRAFTHQLVRNRNSSFAQESLRFAVVGEKQDIPVSLPPSLVGSRTYEEIRNDLKREYPSLEGHLLGHQAKSEASDLDRARQAWEDAKHMIQESYQYLVNSGIPAEDARGLLPTNVQTRIHWAVNLRSLKLEAGKRLSTQAQYEWKAVIAGIARAIREYDPNRQLLWQARNMGDRSAELFLQFISGADDWQYEGISDLFRPICYQLGRCQFRAEIDRSCTIRDRVEANFKIGRDSSEWDKPHYGRPENDGGPEYLTIQPIRPEEWLNDPTAAR